MSEDDDANIKLVDFGFAAVARGDVLTDFLGTEGYIAPKVYAHSTKDATAAPYGKAVDMWAIGVIVVMLLSGCTCFDGDNAEEVNELCVSCIPLVVNVQRNFFHIFDL